LTDYLRFYVPLKNISLIWRRNHCRWRAAKFRPMLGAQGLWTGSDLYRATPAVTRDLGFSYLIRRTNPISHLLRYAWGCGGPTLTRALMGYRHNKQQLTTVQIIHKINWLIDYLRFYVPLKNILLTWRRHHCRWRAAKFRPMLGALCLWAGRDLYRAIPAVTRDLGFSGLIRRTPHLVASYNTRGDVEDLF
jgi:hypothetical protein